MRSRDDLFEWHVVRHLDAAFNLACWMLRNRQDAEDVVQDSVVKALKAFDRFSGPDGKPWFLKIVRNGCLRHLERTRSLRRVPLEDELAGQESFRVSDNPEVAAMKLMDAELVQAAVEALPETYREVLILREFEAMSYGEISEVIGAPLGTVMSRLSRARSALAGTLREGSMVETR